MRQSCGRKPASAEGQTPVSPGRCFSAYGTVFRAPIPLLIPGFTPDTLGQIYIYRPSMTEIKIATAIFAIGFLIFTLMTKIAIAIVFEDFSIESLRRKKQKPAS